MEVAFMLSIKLLAAYEEWCTVCIRGGTGVKWTDGREMNFIRKKIVNIQEEMRKNGVSIPGGLLMEPPPLAEEGFMHEAERLRRNAESALQIYTQEESYEYLMINQAFLGQVELDSMQIKPADALQPAAELKKAVEKNDYLAMRRYSDTEKYLPLMRACRAEMEEVFDDMLPF